MHNEKVPSENISLGKINIIRQARTWRVYLRRSTCRSPSLDEWVEIESQIITLTRHLSAEQLKKVQIKHISERLLQWAAVYFLVSSIVTLVAAVLLLNIEGQNGTIGHMAALACFIFWLATTGALGSTAFIYVNALSIEVDQTVDITSKTLVIMRLILGALFAVILALPFGYHSFQNFANCLFGNDTCMEVKDSVFLLLPFILGFSTPLALQILGRFIISARIFFGLPGQEIRRESVRQPLRQTPSSTTP
jgi:hypothetical protein